MKRSKSKDKKPRKPRELLLPGQFHAGPVTVVAPFRIEEGGSLAGVRKYTVETWRTDGQWAIDLQWIETRNGVLTPIVVHLPHKVCLRLEQQRDAILNQSRKLGARKAFLTAKAKARESERTPTEQQKELGDQP